VTAVAWLLAGLGLLLLYAGVKNKDPRQLIVQAIK
jgi:hypothetical protein